MTAQSPERIILDGRPRELYAQPLYRLIKHFRIDLGCPDYYSTDNYRGYIGTWEIRDRHLRLVQLSWNGQEEIPMPDGIAARVFRAAGCTGFPVNAHWFTGSIRIPIGRQLVYSHQGWSHWFERERIIHFRSGEITRDREVNTHAMLERWLRQYEPASDRFAPSRSNSLGPLIWFDDAEDSTTDWWPPGYPQSPE
ncbi:MAG: hypothetical protein J0I79_10670 [Mesorhizobium sp.]|uniref:hypothetical protein n=1 Tax=Mesorhizobium sp. TaxID=1871066 RepID=UPI001ACA442E|nr:hypothetical protein [Mesorhizobium sp.]MBN9218407.1 hypothetical protein [Mesorhizobium sp.]